MSRTAFVYKLWCLDVKDHYIGSTQNVRSRKYQHKTACNNPNDAKYNRYVYQFIREHGGFDAWDLEIIEEVKYNACLLYTSPSPRDS